MNVPGEEQFGVAVVRAWRREGQLLIRVITGHEVPGDDFDTRGYPTESVDDALEHLREFLERIGP